MDICLLKNSQDIMWVFKEQSNAKSKQNKFSFKCLNKNVPAHAKIQNPINTEIIAQLKAPHML